MPTPVSATNRLNAYRMLAGAAQLIVSGLCLLYLPEWIAVAIPGALGLVLGKLLGMPIAQVTQLALSRIAAREPDRAVTMAVDALQSLPPAHAEAATTRLLASLPPDARARSINPPAMPVTPTAADRPTTIHFIGGTDYPDAPSTNTPPSAPSLGGARLDDDDGTDDAVTRPTRPDRAPR